METSDARRGESGVYAIVNTVSGGRYYGSSCHLGRRWMEHRKRLRGGYHESEILQHAWDKHGESAFRFTVLAVLEQEEILVAEQRLLDQHFGKRYCYNMAPRAADGAMAGRRHGPAAIAKLIAANTGKTHSPEHRAKQSASARASAAVAANVASRAVANRGRKNSPEHIARTAAGHRGMKRSPETCAKIAAKAKGRVASPEARANMSAARKGLRRSSEARANMSAAKTAWWAAKKATLAS